MKKLKTILNKHAFKLLNVMALMLVMQTANATCTWIAYQPEFPSEANKFKRVK